MPGVLIGGRERIHAAGARNVGRKRTLRPRIAAEGGARDLIGLRGILRRLRLLDRLADQVVGISDVLRRSDLVGELRIDPIEVLVKRPGAALGFGEID